MNSLGTALTGLASWLSGVVLHPWLLLAGAAAVAVPILIHLLNRRRFKRLDWAAMDFLLEADKLNRRRVRLEDLLLLLLRCLIVLLVALLVARPFRAMGLAGLLETVRFEQVVLLDDSLSMHSRVGGRTAFENARSSLTEFVAALATGGADNSLTLLLTSRPAQPVLHAVHVDQQTVAEITRKIEELEVSDRSAGLEPALVELEKSLGNRSADVNRVVYLLSDLRRGDWTAPDAALEVSPALGILRRLSQQAAGAFLIDTADEQTSNLILSAVAPQDKALIAGVASRFDVSVANSGPAEVRGVAVKFSAGDWLPQEAVIDSIPAGGTASVPFTFAFAAPQATAAATTDPASALEPVPIQAEITVPTAAQDDLLSADNVRYYAARVVPGIPTLIVDGDPSASYGRSESFYLQRALSPPGGVLSGIAATVATEVELETLPLDSYQVIYLCNLFRVSEEVRAALEKWVAAGGGLVMALGDQVDETFFNEHLFRDGAGLSPVRLLAIRGDESRRNWVHFRVLDADHPVLRVFAGESNPFIESVKIFRHWQAAPPEDPAQAAPVSIPASFADDDASPALAERTFGQGRVLVLNTGVDLDWGNWPQDAPSYLITMQEIVRHMARKLADEGALVVGEPIRHRLDLTQYKLEAGLTIPSGSRVPLQASPPAGEKGADEALWQVGYEATDRRGFYRLELDRTDGRPEHLLFAANVDPREGDLRRVDAGELRRGLAGSNVQLVTGRGLAALGVDDSQGELWLYVLGALVLALCAEQTLAWLFGLRR